ncbi:Txe/YoeB family addiction module toxin [Candidatus Peregrinibacteria bacterium]|nr:MAG: Txe/YoeB family addiction module toxin [Candidatus Peregrinibacteria bacterium]
MKKVQFTKSAYTDFEYWKAKDPKVHSKIIHLLKDIQVSPFVGLGKPEALKYSLKDCWSRRINREHRLVYKVSGQLISVISCHYHY